VILPGNVAVYGGGRMGSGIAHAFLIFGSNVRIIESDVAACEAARRRVTDAVRASEERGGLRAPAGGLLDRLVVTTDATTLAGCDLVVEAVPEDARLKRDVLRSIEQHTPDAVIATNTSSLSIDGLASHLARPERFIGLHFFNPVPSSSLVEIVVGPKTADSLAAQARTWVTELGKTAITVADSPGFASSRLGVALALEAMRMLEAGVATADDIDLAMTLGYRHPVGPLRTTDIVGLDVRLAIADHLAGELGPNFEPPCILREYVAAGRLGRKSGKGFFSW
jgi:3-hydroxybutyryl-CoA dehydrogenase